MIAEWSSSNRDTMTLKPGNIYYLALSQKFVDRWLSGI